MSPPISPRLPLMGVASLSPAEPREVTGLQSAGASLVDHLDFPLRNEPSRLIDSMYTQEQFGPAAPDSSRPAPTLSPPAYLRTLDRFAHLDATEGASTAVTFNSELHQTHSPALGFLKQLNGDFYGAAEVMLDRFLQGLGRVDSQQEAQAKASLLFDEIEGLFFETALIDNKSKIHTKALGRGFDLSNGFGSYEPANKELIHMEMTIGLIILYALADAGQDQPYEKAQSRLVTNSHPYKQLVQMIREQFSTAEGQRDLAYFSDGAKALIDEKYDILAQANFIGAPVGLLLRQYVGAHFVQKRS